MTSEAEKRLEEIRAECERREGGYNSDQQDACFLIAELDRVTAERDELLGQKLKADWTGTMLQSSDRWATAQELSTAIASRNAWAERAQRLAEVLENQTEFARSFLFALTDQDKFHQDHFRARLEAWLDAADKALAPPDSAKLEPAGAKTEGSEPGTTGPVDSTFLRANTDAGESDR